MIFIGSLPLYFNSRPSARGDPVNVERKSFTPSHFNSRPSARGDVRVLVAAIIGAISIHAPPRGATLVFCSSFAFCPFQFTPLREGRPQKETSQRAVIISIHAPPRGATRPRACRAVRRTISIHAPPRGATFLLSVVRPSSTISIHAPPRGATTAKPQGLGAFQFQFTPLREGRPNAFSTLSVLVYFNSRPSARGDGASSSSTGGAALFQFTPLRKGRPEMPDYWLRAPGYFNSRPSARGDPPHMPMAGKETYFNSRRSARGDRAYRRGWSISRYFNSRPSARGDLMARSKTKKISHFNSRPSARGDRAAERRRLHPRISIHAPPRGATITKVNHTCR